MSCKVSQNLYCKQNHEFKTLLCRVKIKNVKNNQNRKTIGFTDFSEDVQQPEKNNFCLFIIGRSTNHFGSPCNINSGGHEQAVSQSSKQAKIKILFCFRI